MSDDGLGDQLLRVEPPRDRWGRVLLPNGEGKSTAYTRATTLAKALSGEKPALTDWKVRLAMHGVVANRTLHNLVAVTPLTDRATLNEVAQRALDYAGANDGRTRGSTLHAACARVMAGGVDLDTLPEDMRADVSAYVQCLAAAGVKVDPALIERMVVNDEVMSAGTFDDVVTVEGLGESFVFDLKSAQGGDDGKLYSDAMDEIEIQLAIYANAKIMVPRKWVPGLGRSQFETPPKVSLRWAIVAHLAAGSGVCTLHWVDIERGWRRVKLAFEARKRGTGFLAWGDAAVRDTQTLALGDGWPVVPGDFDATPEVPYVETVTAEIEAAGIGTAHPLADRILAAIGEKPKRKRRSRAEIERDNAEAAKALMPALDAPAGDRATVDPELDAINDQFAADLTAAVDPARAFVVTQEHRDPDGTRVVDQVAHVTVDPVPVGVYGTSGGALDTVTLEYGTNARGHIQLGEVDTATDGVHHPDGTFTPDRFGDESRSDTSDAALDASLAARDLRVRDEILAERKAIRIDKEIRAAIEDACKPGTAKGAAQKHLALAYDLWSSDWREDHTAYGMGLLAKL